MPVLRVLQVCIEQGVCPVGLLQLSMGDGVVEPTVVGLTSDLSYPARDRDRNTVSNKLAHERVDPFPGKCDWDM